MSESLFLPLLEPLNGKCTLRISERQRGTCGVFQTYFTTKLFLCRASFRTGISGTHLSHSGLAYLETLQCLITGDHFGHFLHLSGLGFLSLQGLVSLAPASPGHFISWLLALFSLVCLSSCLTSRDFPGLVLESSNSTQLPPSQIISFWSPES